MCFCLKTLYLVYMFDSLTFYKYLIQSQQHYYSSWIKLILPVRHITGFLELRNTILGSHLKWQNQQQRAQKCKKTGTKCTAKRALVCSMRV